jgi:DNA-binding transcriptional regulator of glucitol operon
MAGVVIFLLAGCVALVALREDSVEDLKQRVENTSVGERPALCIQIAERQLDEANRLYVAGDSAKAQSALMDVAAYAEQARDYAIRAHKREKQSEIAVRKMTRKLTNLKHAVSREEQEQIQQTIDRLERVRDDLLAAMFPKGAKK